MSRRLARSMAAACATAAAAGAAVSAGISTSRNGGTDIRQRHHLGLALAVLRGGAAQALCEAWQPTLQEREGRNVVLGGATQKHQVALCEWPLDLHRHNGDPRTASARNLFKWVRDAGYDGVEMTCEYFRRYWPNEPLDIVADKARAVADEFGMKIFGSNVWDVQDWHFDEPDFAETMRKKVSLTKRMGGGYVTFQVWLSNEHQVSQSTFIFFFT